MVIRKCQISSMALIRGHFGTLLFLVSVTIPFEVSSKQCSVFVLNLDDPETYSRRNVNCSHHDVSNDICCSGTCCQVEENQLFKIETVDGIFKVEKSQSNLEDLVEIARRGKTIVFKKVKRLEEFAEAESQYWLTIIIVVPCIAILLIIICIILCCCCCPNCPGARKRSKNNSNQTNQTAHVVQIPMQYMPNPQQQAYPEVYPYPRQQIHPDPLPRGYQPHSQQPVYPNPPQQQAYPNPPQHQTHPNPSQQQAYQHSPQPPTYQGPRQDNLQPKQGQIHSVGFQDLTPKPQPGEPNRNDEPSAPLPT